VVVICIRFEKRDVLHRKCSNRDSTRTERDCQEAKKSRNQIAGTTQMYRAVRSRPNSPALTARNNPVIRPKTACKGKSGKVSGASLSKATLDINTESKGLSEKKRIAEEIGTATVANTRWASINAKTLIALVALNVACPQMLVLDGRIQCIQ